MNSPLFAGLINRNFIVRSASWWWSLSTCLKFQWPFKCNVDLFFQTKRVFISSSMYINNYLFLPSTERALRSIVLVWRLLPPGDTDVGDVVSILFVLKWFPGTSRSDVEIWRRLPETGVFTWRRLSDVEAAVLEAPSAPFESTAFDSVHRSAMFFNLIICKYKYSISSVDKLSILQYWNGKWLNIRGAAFIICSQFHRSHTDQSYIFIIFRK